MLKSTPFSEKIIEEKRNEATLVQIYRLASFKKTISIGEFDGETAYKFFRGYEYTGVVGGFQLDVK